MKQFIGNLILVLVSTLLVNCVRFEDKINLQIKKQCDFSKNDTCIIDFKDVISEDFDTIFIFDGYALPEAPSVIAESNPNIKSNGGAIYGTEDDKIVFVKNKKIIHEERLKHESIYFEKGIKVQKEGIFDGNMGPLYEAEMYATSRFEVVKDVDNGKFIYTLKPLLK
jgi:hypothetical protein